MEVPGARLQKACRLLVLLCLLHLLVVLCFYLGGGGGGGGWAQSLWGQQRSPPEPSPPRGLQAATHRKPLMLRANGSRTATPPSPPGADCPDPSPLLGKKASLSVRRRAVMRASERGRTGALRPRPGAAPVRWWALAWAK